MNPEQVLAGGGADVVIDWMPSALATREKGSPVVNIAQPFKRSGLELTCRADSGIKDPKEFPGHTLGVWFGGNEYPFLAWMAKLGIKTDGPPGVTVLKQGFNVDPAVAEAGRLHLDHDLQRILADHRGRHETRRARRLQLHRRGRLDDGGRTLCARTEAQGSGLRRQDGAFVKASMMGWDYAQAHPAEAVKIVLDNDSSGAQTEEHQTHMMDDVNKLTKGSDGALDPADYERTVKVLLSSGSDPVITKPPVGAWTHAVTDKADIAAK